MAPISTLFSTLLLLGAALAAPAPDKEVLEKRGVVDDCKAVLVALKASSFCSSFVPITDKTSTVTSTKPTVTSTITVNAPPCTITGPPAAAVTETVTTTEQTDTTITTTTTITSTIYNKKKRAAATTTAAAAKATCSIKGVPVKINAFGCDVIKSACNLFVKPKTITTTATVPGPTVTATSTTTQPCDIVTPTPTSTSTATVTNTNTITETATTTVTTTTCAPAVFTRPASASNGQAFLARDDAFIYNAPDLGRGNGGSELACINSCAANSACRYYTWSNSYLYCELKGEATNICQGGSSDFKCGRRV